MILKNTIEFDLLTNAQDSLRQAVEILAFKDIGNNHARLKHAITASAQCIELLLKERLRRIKPELVWERVDKYPNLNANTVRVDVAISRLKSYGNVTFSIADEGIVASLRTTRNAIEHYEWKISEKEAKLILANALSFIFSFAKSELQIDLATIFQLDDTWKMLLDELVQFHRLHAARIEMQLRAKGDYPQSCDDCGELTVPMQGGSCELCGHWQSLD